ncbi:hypothetical protein SODALDRAFT_364183 [Sodiomyces alkalinus F11]|uniref:Uncharacterized protein n=1 Tax=Sodiomyces alkalinus (strain CBS 110278 / VKM F-3762 / F11) TaxID=1314773 RepID=A0A3N2PJS5_SODAK|nr:hypothetical protein SODALDRAFT_364183 [Sodiomyces alkalinus F11]ROT34680.1 hypothetical protein SODALDRAFT_364183 [Sodiomyces alkalinus F11]
MHRHKGDPPVRTSLAWLDKVTPFALRAPRIDEPRWRVRLTLSAANRSSGSLWDVDRYVRPRRCPGMKDTEWTSKGKLMGGLVRDCSNHGWISGYKVRRQRHLLLVGQRRSVIWSDMEEPSDRSEENETISSSGVDPIFDSASGEVVVVVESLLVQPCSVLFIMLCRTCKLDVDANNSVLCKMISQLHSGPSSLTSLSRLIPSANPLFLHASYL